MLDNGIVLHFSENAGIKTNFSYFIILQKSRFCPKNVYNTDHHWSGKKIGPEFADNRMGALLPDKVSAVQSNAQLGGG